MKTGHTSIETRSSLFYRTHHGLHVIDDVLINGCPQCGERAVIHCMARGWKDVENRNWPLSSKMRHQLPQRIYLHASKTKTPKCEIDDCILDLLTDEQKAEFEQVDWSNRGAIIGEVTITKQVTRKSPGWDTLEGFNSPWFLVTSVL